MITIQYTRDSDNEDYMSVRKGEKLLYEGSKAYLLEHSDIRNKLLEELEFPLLDTRERKDPNQLEMELDE